MRKFISFNGKILSCEKAFLTAVSSAAFYGKGVFTTVAVYGGKPFQWEKHHKRLFENASKTGVDLSDFESRKIERSLNDVIEKNKLENARVRLTFFDRSANEIWNCRLNEKTAVLITVADLRPRNDDFRLTISPFSVNSRSPLSGVKSCNYLENLLVLKEAQARNFNETVRANERGEIVGAAMANVFWIKDDEIFTPPLETGCLDGTTRSFILENFPVRERKIDFAEFGKADEIFLTSAGIGIARVKSLDGKTLGEKIINQIESEFSKLILL